MFSGTILGQVAFERMSHMPLHVLEPFIHERITDDGRLTGYQVKIRRVGFPKFTKTFDSLAEARIAVTRVFADQSRGDTRNTLLAERTTLGDVIREAIADLKEGRRVVKGKASELSRLKMFLERDKDLCAHAMSRVTETLMRDWVAERLDDAAAGTVLRELRVLRPILKSATKKLHMVSSPLEDVANPTVQDERIARFEPGEQDKLFAELVKCRNSLVVLAAEFSLETACRRSELLALHSKKYKADKGTIYLPTAKNGRGRDVLLTVRAQEIVDQLLAGGREGFIFTITREALAQAFDRARERAAMEHWRWHDLRHEAISKAFDAGLAIHQIMDFSGHVDLRSLERYRHADKRLAVAAVRTIAPILKSKAA